MKLLLKKKTLTDADSVLKAVLRCLGRGWPVFPVKNKKPRVEWARFQKELPTKEQLMRWLRFWPKTNIAIVTGEISNIVVLDIDAKYKGHDTLNDLENKYGKLPLTAEVETGGGGKHLYFKYPSFSVKNATIARGVEIKGDGGSVTCPPSLHESGKRYRWKAHPDQVGIAQMPDWLINLIQEEKPSSENNEGLICEGSRNETLTRYAGTFRNQGLSEQQIFPILQSINRAICNPPLGDQEIAAIAKSIGKYDSAAYIPSKASKRKWISGSELETMPIPEIEWVWVDYVARSLITMISAYAKTGKTTLLRILIRQLLKSKTSSSEQFLGRKISLNGKILVLSEEPPILFKSKAKDYNLLHPELLILFRSSIEDWRECLSQIVKAIEEEKVELIVVDTLAEFWDAGDENDAKKVLESLKVLKKIAHNHEIAVLILHHTRKGGGEDGEAHRGSSAIMGAVDIPAVLRRDKSNPQKRILVTLSRVGSVPDQVIELVGNEYVSYGSVIAHKRENVERRVMDVLPAPKGKPISRKEIMSKLDPKPSETLLKEILADHIEIEKIGTGRKGSPLRYRRKAKKKISKTTPTTTGKFKERLKKAQSRWESTAAKAKRRAGS